MIDEHRAAVQYDLIRHGFRLDDVGTTILPWVDAVVILTMQPPDSSALYRRTHPDEYDRDKKIDRLETIAVLLVRGQMLSGNQTEVSPSDLPTSWEDLFDKVRAVVDVDDEELLARFAAIDARMG